MPNENRVISPRVGLGTGSHVAPAVPPEIWLRSARRRWGHHRTV